MTIEIILLLAILVIAMVLFSVETVPADVVGLGVMIVLLVLGLLTPEETFAGFGSQAFILIFSLLIMTAALIRTGVVDIAGRLIMRKVGDNPKRLVWVMMAAVATLSAFISNTAATAFFAPIAIGTAKRVNVSPSRLLMPLAFSSILTSSVTVISSSSNIVISGLIVRYGERPLGLFEMAVVGIPVTIVGLAYMILLGNRLIPERGPSQEIEDQGKTLPYSTEVVVLPRSPLIGKAVTDLAEDDEISLRVVKVGGNNGSLMIPATGRAIEEGDVLLVEGQRDELLKIKDTAGIDFKAAPPPVSSEEDTQVKTVEAIILPGSSLIGQNLKRLRFRERFGIQVMGIHRSGRTIDDKLSRTRLRVGDQLLLQAEPEKLSLLGRYRHLRIIGDLDESIPNRPRARWAMLIFGGALVLGSLNLVPLAVAVLIGAFLMLATRTIAPEEAYREIEWKALVLIGSMLALGQAMETTGTAAFIANQITSSIGGFSPLILLSAFFLLTLILTQPMSNQAAAVVVVPIAMQVANQLGLNPRTFAIMIAVAASCSYTTPLEPSCMIVYGPGRYRFMDFVKVGSILTVLIFILAVVLVPLFWPL
jgi:di/tricarboxylate transporter